MRGGSDNSSPSNPDQPTIPINPGTPIEPVHPEPIPPNATLEEMFIKPEGGTVPVGVSGQLMAYGVYSDGTVSDLTAASVWGSSDSSVMSVNAAGFAIAQKAGTVTIKAQNGNKSATAVFNVKPLEVTKIDLTFANGQTNVSVPIGTTGTLKATATLSDGEKVNATPYVTFNVNPVGIVEPGTHGFVKAVKVGTASIVASYGNIKSNPVSVTVTGVQFDHLEIQEGYTEGGNGKVITGQTIGLQIVDNVNYDPVSPGAYYPTAWAVYSDGSKRYVNTEVSWWSADMTRVYVNSVQGSFVFGRGITDGPVEVRATYRGDEVPGGSTSASFYVTVTSPINNSVIQLGIKNTKANGWGCSDFGDYANSELVLNVGEDGKFLQACGLYLNESTGEEEWKDLNDNVAWFSSDPDVARVQNLTGELQAKAEGHATVTIQFEQKEASILVNVVE